MADKVKVRLQRAYLWDNENGGVDSYGPGDVEIPRAMAEGLQRENVDIGIAPLLTKEEIVHPRILAQRGADASTRIVAATTKLAKQLGLDEEAKALKVDHEDGDVQVLLRTEAAAALLETLAKEMPSDEDRLASMTKVAEEAVLERIEAIDGVGRKTIEAIRQALAEPAPAATSEPAQDQE